ncbi:MAG: CpXC domain-containing protein, partial [Anaerolineales bacterium]
MPPSQISCPRCRQMISAQVEQLFDVTADPGAKQRLLGRVSNYARCPHCGFEGPLSTPIVYHDNEKELLLTFFPSELGLPVNEQEKMVGPLITKVTEKLPAEKRKGYLLRPQSFLTYQSMIERILEADGISKEMLGEQQKRVDLIQRLLQTTTPEVRADIIKENGALLDEAFFGMFNRLMEAAMQSGQQPTAQAMSALQEELLEGSEYGRELKGQFEEIQAAVQTLQEVGQGLTREKLLEIFIEAPSEARLKAIVSLTRNGLDYSFFQILTERIEKASGEEREKLESLRETLLDITNQIDKAMEAQMKSADEFIEQILSAPNISEVVVQNIEQFNNEAIA